MRRFKRLKQKQKVRAFRKLLAPALKRLAEIAPLESRGDRPLQMTFEEQLNALVYFHLEEFVSGRHLIQALEQDDFANECVSPPKGIKKSAFFEAINTRGLEQLSQLFTALVADASKILPAEFAHLEKELRVVGYRADAKDYRVATNRHDLSAEDVAQVYKLRWDIETFFGWWKRHLKVYHLIARSPYGLMVQLLGGLITYLLLAIYCREQHGEKVSIHRVRELRIQIANEAAELQQNKRSSSKFKQSKRRPRRARN